MALPPFVELPDGLDDMRPGPELSAVLADLDPRAYTGHQLAILLGAQYRQIACEQARMLQTVRELAYATTEGDGLVAPLRDTKQNPFTAVEMSFAVTWTSYTSEKMVELAMLTVDEVPVLGAALRTGRVDLDKVKVIVKETELLDTEHRAQVIEAIIDDAEHESTATLRARIRRTVLKVDPEAVRRKHQKAVEDRQVTHDSYANGTAGLFGTYLPKDKAAAAFDYIDAIARATRSAGDPRQRSLDNLRADVMLDLLAGVDPARAGAANPAPRKGAINLRVDLVTLACLSDSPGEIDGFGPVTADMARQTAEQLALTSQWRYSVTDNGDVIAEGVLNKQVAKALAEFLTRRAADTDAGPDGRARYRPTAAQAAFILARDRTCQAGGCNRPARWCDIDHNLDWDHDGPTLIDALCCLCRYHHMAKHVGNFRVRRGPLGTEWTTPFGHRYTVVPRDRPIPTEAEQHLAQVVKETDIGRLRR